MEAIRTKAEQKPSCEREEQQRGSIKAAEAEDERLKSIAEAEEQLRQAKRD